MSTRFKNKTILRCARTLAEEGVKLNTICRRAGLSLDRDGSYSYYVGEQIVSDSFMGVAPILLAALEMERLP